jgi:hypothetical protein
VSIFSRKDNAAAARPQVDRTPRHSSGWAHMKKYLKSHEGLRVLDIGPTSPTNINYVTGLGHSIYMANLVEEANKPEWVKQNADGESTFDVDGFLTQNLNFSGRTFDVVTLWDVPDYLPPAALSRVMERLYDVTDPGAQILAFFHAKATGPDTEFVRYHLTDEDSIDMQRYGGYAIQQTFTTRQVEKLFAPFSSNKFLLAKDALREVIVTR